ncbi:MAG: hypothetical protein A2Y94_12435 [Caldithrix sp. RBG_13_44_9]|nr:MAG: hypothetical protein A2Y94_12435 [Caldithrix sp. RBG_13_44_9]
MRWFIFLISAAFLFFINCDKETNSIDTDNGSTGTLKIYLTDSPAEYEAVNITFSEVSAHINDQWLTVRGDSVTVNLLDWNNGNSIILGEAELPAGHYTQIRLMIQEAEIVVDGQTFPLTVPSGAQTGLKMGPEFTLTAGSTYELVVDFDVARSIVVTGPRHDPHSYKLKPHLRCVPRAISGSISGIVTNPEHLPLAYALQNSDTITSAIVDTSDGYFQLSFLSEGGYTVSLRDTLDQYYNQDNVAVTNGVNNDLGSITLQ